MNLDELTFEIPGEPCGKGRPRFRRAGVYVSTYTPRKTQCYERDVVDAYIVKYGKLEPMQEMLEMDIEAGFTIPKATSKAKRQAMLDGDIRPTKKPDWDNIGKIICDALNGVAYADDKQIVRACVTKRYAQNAGVKVSIRKIRKENE